MRLLIILFTLCAVGVPAQNERDYIRRGNRLMRDTVYAKAQVEYQKAIEFDNTSAQAHYNLGCALFFQNKPEDAMREYDTAVKFEHNPRRKAQIYHNMGVVMQTAQQYDKAVACYQNSLRNDPTCDETRYNYALALYMLKKQPPQGGGESQNQNDQGQDEKKEQDKQEQKEEKQNDSSEQQNPQPKDEMSKENAEQMLKAAMQDEKDTQEKIQRALQQPQQKRLQKQW